MMVLRSRRLVVVALVVTLALLLAVEKPARAQGLGDLAYSDYAVKIAPSVRQFLGWTTSGSAVVYTAYGTVAEISTSAGAAVAGGVTVAGAAGATVAAASGALLGWGAYEAGIWSWLGCEHVLNTGSAACDPDMEPVPPTAGGKNTVDMQALPLLDTGPNSDGYWSWRLSWDNSVVGNTRNVRGCDNMGQGMQYVSSWTSGDWGYYNCSGFQGQDTMDHVRWCQGGSAVSMAECLALSVSDPAVVFDWSSAAAVASDRKVVVDLECTDYAGGTGDVQAVAVESAPYAPGDEPLVPAGSCPEGYTITSMSATRKVIGDDGTLDEQIFEDEREGLSTTDEYADCYDGSCELVLHKVAGSDTGSCYSDEVNCAGWWDATQGGTVDNGTFECRWGTHVMPLADCDAFRNIDVEGVEAPVGTPSGPVTEPGTAANPAEVEDGCDAGGGSWLNPFDNIAGGIACALEWAFVPSTESMDQLDAQTAALGGSVPFTYVTQVGAWAEGFGSVGDGSGCLRFEAPIEGFGTYDVFDCNGPVGSRMQEHRTLLTIAVWGLFLLPLGWWAWRQYAPGSQGEA